MSDYKAAADAALLFPGLGKPPAPPGMAMAKQNSIPRPRITDDAVAPQDIERTSRNSATKMENSVGAMLGSEIYSSSMRKPHPVGTGLVRCKVRRNKALLGATTYQLCLDEGDVPLLAAKKTKAAFLICPDMGSCQSNAEGSCIAQLTVNMMGSEYLLQSDSLKGAGVAEEEMLIQYKATGWVGPGAPRSMQVVLPAVGQGSVHDLSRLLEQANAQSLDPESERSVLMLTTKPPRLDESTQGYVADFEGHPKVEQSTKNIQLIQWVSGGGQGASKSLLFQFCRTGKDEFAMDFAGPLSTLAAFAIALSCMDDHLLYSLG